MAELAANLSPQVMSDQLHEYWLQHLQGIRSMFIAELNNKVIGTVSTTNFLHQQPNSLRALALGVSPEFRRRGIGNALMEAIEQKAVQDGLGYVNLEVNINNTHAIHLYEQRGYKRLGNPEWVLGALSWVMIKTL